MKSNDKNINLSTGTGGYLFIQSALLVLYYGFKISLPKFVLWFPSIIIGGIIGIVLLVLVCAIISDVCS